jgi:predicted lipoprotein
LATNTTESNIAKAQTDWRNLRNEWEQSESFLFGPVATEGLDPAIDTWPVNKNDLDSLLASSVVFSDSYMQNAQESLKGFHPLEYLIFGANGTKTSADFTAREKEYMVALAKELKRICNMMPKSWDVSHGDFSSELKTAGIGSITYKTKKEAMLEIVNAMAGICDEVANGKIEEPFIAQNPNLEESPFSKNSFGDFKNNMQGVQNVYLCSYATKGASISDWVKQYNVSLDSKIRSQVAASISTFSTFSKPFGQAIISEQVQILNTQKILNQLKETLENELVPLINLNVKN